MQSPQGSDPLPPGLSSPLLPGGECGAPILDLWEGATLVLSPTRWSCRPVEWGWVGAWRSGSDTVPHALLGAPPSPAPAGHQPALPQHQGSREALPRQRLSLRCQALWMRVRASSNFLLEASWMALLGRSTWVGRGGDLRATAQGSALPVCCGAHESLCTSCGLAWDHTHPADCSCPSRRGMSREGNAL